MPRVEILVSPSHVDIAQDQEREQDQRYSEQSDQTEYDLEL